MFADRYTLTIVFNRDKSKVLMCEHQKLGRLNYVGGKVKESEGFLEASYRELYEETGITKEKIFLKYVRREQVANFLGEFSDIYVTTGVLYDEEFELVEEKNRLKWISILDTNTILMSYGHGRNYMLLIEAAQALNPLNRLSLN